MDLTPPGYERGNGVFVIGKTRCALIVDTNGDDRADLLVTVSVDGELPADGTAAAARLMDQVDADGDGFDDILWRNNTTGADVIWKSASSATQQPVTGVTDLDWHVVGAGDYNGDNVADVLWRNVRSGANAIWRSANIANLQLALLPGSEQEMLGHRQRRQWQPAPSWAAHPCPAHYQWNTSRKRSQGSPWTPAIHSPKRSASC